MGNASIVVDAIKNQTENLPQVKYMQILLWLKLNYFPSCCSMFIPTSVLCLGRAKSYAIGHTLWGKVMFSFFTKVSSGRRFINSETYETTGMAPFLEFKHMH